MNIKRMRQPSGQPMNLNPEEETHAKDAMHAKE